MVSILITLDDINSLNKTLTRSPPANNQTSAYPSPGAAFGAINNANTPQPDLTLSAQPSTERAKFKANKVCTKEINQCIRTSYGLVHLKAKYHSLVDKSLAIEFLRNRLESLHKLDLLAPPGETSEMTIDPKGIIAQGSIVRNGEVVTSCNPNDDTIDQSCAAYLGGLSDELKAHEAEFRRTSLGHLKSSPPVIPHPEGENSCYLAAALQSCFSNPALMNKIKNASNTDNLKPKVKRFLDKIISFSSKEALENSEVLEFRTLLAEAHKIEKPHKGKKEQPNTSLSFDNDKQKDSSEVLSFIEDLVYPGSDEQSGISESGVIPLEETTKGDLSKVFEGKTLNTAPEQLRLVGTDIKKPQETIDLKADQVKDKKKAKYALTSLILHNGGHFVNIIAKKNGDKATYYLCDDMGNSNKGSVEKIDDINQYLNSKNGWKVVNAIYVRDDLLTTPKTIEETVSEVAQKTLPADSKKDAIGSSSPAPLATSVNSLTSQPRSSPSTASSSLQRGAEDGWTSFQAGPTGAQVLNSAKTSGKDDSVITSTLKTMARGLLPEPNLKNVSLKLNRVDTLPTNPNSIIKDIILSEENSKALLGIESSKFSDNFDENWKGGEHLRFVIQLSPDLLFKLNSKDLEKSIIEAVKTRIIPSKDAKVNKIDVALVNPKPEKIQTQKSIPARGWFLQNAFFSTKLVDHEVSFYIKRDDTQTYSGPTVLDPDNPAISIAEFKKQIDTCEGKDIRFYLPITPNNNPVGLINKCKEVLQGTTSMEGENVIKTPPHTLALNSKVENIHFIAYPKSYTQGH